MQRELKGYTASNNFKPATNYTTTNLSEPVRLRIGKEGVTADAPQTIPQLFSECCQRFSQLSALVYENQQHATSNTSTNSTWTTVTYADYELNVEKAALALIHVGLTPNTSVCVLAENCPEWYYVQLGALRAGGVVSGIYLTSSPEAVQHALETSLATICVMQDAIQLAKVLEVRAKLPRLKAVIQLYGLCAADLTQEAGYYCWSDLMALPFDLRCQQALIRQEREVAANQCALLIFTSGTTGFPKAIMLSHDSIVVNIKYCLATLAQPLDCAGVTLSYLPLNHIAAQLFEVLMPLLNGDCVYFAGSGALKGSLTKTLRIARPTRIFGVPRVYEKLQQQLKEAEENSSLWWRFVTAWAKRQLLNCYRKNAEEIKPKPTIAYMLASLLMQPFKAQLGLERCDHFWVGGAPLSTETKKFFLSMNIPIADMLGASEAGGAITLTRGYCHLNSCGRAMHGMQIKIDKPNKEAEGEICLHSRCHMMGYLNEPQKTSETIDAEGWLRTGDVGRLCSDGCLIITGRIKEIIITAGGVNIPPIFIENLIKAELPCISNALMVGDKRKYLTVLLTLKTNIDGETGLPTDTLHPDAIAWLHKLGLSYACLSAVLRVPAFEENYDYKGAIPKPAQRIVEAIESGLARANKNALSHAQRVQKFALLPHDFTLRTGELGPTLKSRRRLICQKYANTIEHLYGEDT
ncbi:PREDICTED: long-chain-fatty-acid--CoA ligase bubblegum-like [Rhagoletis zephyria]|uniref:long-chain-fatty-acid--CoA ligase bubblegum-like n=1 Tax=Rhagoletis zephyria TaxID=28612 RepID=UPI000811579D|nr:PREDICTED: long-chain-fatty-acid--CoA ligase bubblegum-like [Rhagoletis zephyria]